MDYRQVVIGGWLAAWLLWAVFPVAGAEDQATFPLREVAVFENKEVTAEFLKKNLLDGQYGFCSQQRSAEVKKYPKLKSSQPLYGTVEFGQSYFGNQPTERFYFALDESGDTAADKPEKKEKSLLQSLLGALVGSGGSEEGQSNRPYDRLYFDANGDLDLTNDPVIGLMKDPPAGVEELVSTFRGYQVHPFAFLSAALDAGSKERNAPVRLLPELMQYGPDFALMRFIPAVARKGTVRLGEQEYTALLAQSGSVSGRFDSPFTALRLTPVESTEEESYRPDYLCQMRDVEGQFYGFSATPSGDKLTVIPYRGEFGLLKVAPASKEVEKCGVQGWFISEKPALLVLGGDMYGRTADKPSELRMPVGDYQSMRMIVDVGRVSLTLQPDSYGTDGLNKKRGYPIHIRKDKPFVLDFSGKPEIVFSMPGKGTAYSRGDEMHFEAMMTDRSLGMMIGGLDDKSKASILGRGSLDPTIVITDSSGKEVDQGKMPFG